MPDKKGNNNFLEECKKYGLVNVNKSIYGDYVVVDAPRGNIYILMDKNYNTLLISRYKDIDDRKRSIESNLLGNELKFDYPFNDYSIEDLISVSEKIVIMDVNQGYNLITKLNGVSCQYKLHDDTIQMLSYIKFLWEKIKEYFLYQYHMMILGFEVVDVYTYVNSLMKGINECIDIYSDKKEIYPSDLVSFLGQDGNRLRDDIKLYDIIDLLKRDNVNNKLLDVANTIKDSINSDILEVERYDKKLVKRKIGGV